MSGIYIHVPFCKSRCIYCDFYSTTLLGKIDAYVIALLHEIEQRKDYLNDKAVHTIYFGGGTPSILSAQQIQLIMDALHRNYDISDIKECTLEATPNELTPDYLAALKSLGFNRLSMGVETFNDEILKIIRRRHDSQQAIQAVTNAFEAGFDNVSIDLIYGLPKQTLEVWHNDVEHAIQLGVEHISAYGLTFEPDTYMNRMLKEGKIEKASDETYLLYYNSLNKWLKEAGYVHYEISNYCKPGYNSSHNTSYWKDIEYLGFGPSAHSYNGTERQWNESSLNLYIKAIDSGKLYYETEELTRATLYNDYVITALRTMWGINLDTITERYGKDISDFCLKSAKPYIKKGRLKKDKQQITLTEDGSYVSDDIMRSLIWLKEL